jgi:hypothetical protein
MGVSQSLFSICEVQEDKEFITYLSQLDSYRTPDPNYQEFGARRPTLNDIYESLKNAGIEIISERKVKDEIKLKEGKDFTIHILDIKDDVSEHNEDLTLKYPTQNGLNDPIENISGIKTHYRILIKLATELTKFCGSIYVLNPYESFFIEKGRSFEQICNDLKNKSG